MNPSAHAFRVGLFLVLGIALLVSAVVFVLGGQLFTAREAVQMRFPGSVYGLKVGSPVVFRGVDIGTVTSLGLGHGSEAGDIEIPVIAMLDRNAVMQLGPARPDAVDVINALISEGLSAKLASQSLLTGQLYVDLDLRPTQVKPGPATARMDDAVPDIPTLPSTTQALQAQLEGVDLNATLKDVAAVAKAAREIMQDPQIKATLENAAKLSVDLRTLAQNLQSELKPIAATAQTALAQAGTAAGALEEAASRIAQVAQRLDATLAPDAPLMQSVQNTAEELSQTATSLRDTVGGDGELINNLNRAAIDVARAARQMGDLAELLERQPNALLRGRAPAP